MSKGFQPDLKILFLRHGQAIANEKRAFLGRQDDPLTDLGLTQIDNLAARLEDTRIDAIYTSPLQRAARTAQKVAKHRALEPKLCSALVEQDFGDWDGIPVAEVLKTDPDLFARWRQSGPEVRPPGGESLLEVAERIVPWFEEIKHLHMRGDTIAIVGHGGALQALLCKLLEVPLRPLWPFKLALASISEIHYTHGLPSLIRLSA